MKVKRTHEEQFSVLLPVYYKDDPVLFERALESIFNNTLQPAEVIVVQDGPLGQNLKEVINSYVVNDILKVFELPHNMGLSYALNYGVTKVKTKFVFRADADDYNYPKRFEIQLRYLQNGYDCVGTWVEEKDKSRSETRLRVVPEDKPAIKRMMRMRNPFNHMTVAFKLQMVLEAGGYPHLYGKEDYGLWAKFLKAGAAVYNIQEVLVEANFNRASLSRRGGRKYITSEIQLQRLLLSSGNTNLLCSIFYGFCRICSLALNSAAKDLLYRRLLRQRYRDVKFRKKFFLDAQQQDDK